MKTLIGLTLTAALLGVMGCATTDEGKYLADQPPPLANRDRAPTTIDPVKLTTRTPLTADEVNETNYSDMARRLDGELKADGRGMSKVGK